MQPISISRTALSLRELRAEDVDAIHAVYADPRVTRHLSFEPRTREDVTGIVRRAIIAAADHPRTEYSLAVADSRDEPIGFARLALDPHQQRAATIGFALGRDQWGHGLGTETVRALMTLGFGVLDLHRIWAARAPANEASHRTLLRAGMIQEGRIRGHVLVHGAWRDSITYGILRDEWHED
jgi:RimJ/RimL family protein N-acetyltransferase